MHFVCASVQAVLGIVISFTYFKYFLELYNFFEMNISF